MKRILPTPDGRPGLRHLLDTYERQIIEAALRQRHGNQRRAAADLGLLPTTLHEKMKRLGLLRRERAAANVEAAASAPASSWAQAS